MVIIYWTISNLMIDLSIPQKTVDHSADNTFPFPTRNFQFLWKESVRLLLYCVMKIEIQLNQQKQFQSCNYMSVSSERKLHEMEMMRVMNRFFRKILDEKGCLTRLGPRSCKRSDTLFQKSLLLFSTWREYFYSQPTHFSSQPKK